MNEPTPAPNENQNENPTPGTHSVGGKVLLAVTAFLLIGWMAWLSYTALTKSHEPIVSHAQAAAAQVPVVAELTDGKQDQESFLIRPGGIQGQNVMTLHAQSGKPGFVVKITDPLHSPNGPAKDTEIGVWNLPNCSGYTGPGEYLLLLNKDEGATLDGKPAFYLVGQQRSPGEHMEGIGPPMIYRWGPDVQAQVKRLFP